MTHTNIHKYFGVFILENLNLFLKKTVASLKHSQEKQRAATILTRWYTVWPTTKRNITYTSSNHGVFLHFNQMIGSTWSHVFKFHISSKNGLSMRGPDTDRARKSHKHRDNPMDRSGLDAVFEVWSIHPEAHPAGSAVEFFLKETPDETWEACLQEVLQIL